MGTPSTGPGAPLCSCTPQQRRRYLSRISGPLLDRVDLRVGLVRPTLADLEFGASDAEPTAVVAARVLQARERAARRYAGTPFRVNANVPGPVVRASFGLEPLRPYSSVTERTGRIGCTPGVAGTATYPQ